MTDDAFEMFDRCWSNAGEGCIQTIVGNMTQNVISLQMEEWEFDSPHGTTSRADDLPVTEKAKRQLRCELDLRRSYVAALYGVAMSPLSTKSRMASNSKGLCGAGVFDARSTRSFWNFLSQSVSILVSVQ